MRDGVIRAVSIEIERKFRLAEAPPWLGECPADQIARGYLCLDDESEVRLRRKDTDLDATPLGRRLRLTVKRGRGRRTEEPGRRPGIAASR